jgi:uncharacterized protein YabN with tetrapyrrole methylase and pyrophosphatase domain
VGGKLGDAAASVGAQAAAAAGAEERDERFAAIGELLFAAVALARDLQVDPELALRHAAGRFRAGVEAEAGEPRDSLPRP